MAEPLCPIAEGRCAEVERIGPEVERIGKKIFGNGQPGLVSDVRAIEERQALIYDDLQSTKKAVGKIQRVLYVGLGALGGLQAVLKFVTW